MFEYIGDRLSNAMKNIRGLGRITEENISDAMREIRMALLEADVNYQVVKEFVANVKEKALGLDVGKSLKPDELFIKLVKDELIHLLGEESVALETEKCKNNNVWKNSKFSPKKTEKKSTLSCM